MSTNTEATGSGASASDAALPTTEAEIDELRKEIDRLDAEILAAVKRRTEVSRIIGQTRMASGGTRLVHSR
ncbi:MAG: chorismate mutase, partial [Rhodococcus sp. (in: high G+C Gram-positive bacteria)]|nr:chorismate mutase [Rhodococcus sp. (in: high G+C Gram-positive bacteria)]